MHVDQVTARVLCAYFGEGTEYLHDRGDPSSARDREASWSSRMLPSIFAETPEPRRPEESSLAQCSQGDVFVVKGQKWKGDGEAALHRSPKSSCLRMIARVDIHTAAFAEGLERSDRASSRGMPSSRGGTDVQV